MSQIDGWTVTPTVDRYDVQGRVLLNPEERAALKGPASYLEQPEVWHRAVARDGLTVWFRVGLTPDGRLVCTEADVRWDRPITSSVLKRVPFTPLVERIATWEFDGTEVGAPASPVTGQRRWLDDEAMEVLMDEDLRALYFAHRDVTPPAGDSPARGAVGPSATDLERFAEAYLVAARTRPTRAIAETVRLLGQRGFTISRATAHRWRDACQERGLIGRVVADSSDVDPWTAADRAREAGEQA